MNEVTKCECCGEEIREDDSFVDEDTHDILCSECYFRDADDPEYRGWE